MPGFDRTGPEGRGPMTGGRRGLCQVPTQNRLSDTPARTGYIPRAMGFAWRVFSGGKFGLGLRRGFGGRGRR